ANAQLLDFQSKSNLERVRFFNICFFGFLLKTPPKRHTKLGGFKKKPYLCTRFRRRRQGQEKGIKRGNIREEHPLLIDI
uniref:hypothetical protein n=1 Tax=Prevotella sp. TaxID=59823 RepID=UPI0040280658